MRTRYLIADASLGVGVASLGVGAYLWLASEPRSRARRPGVQVGVQLGRGVSVTAVTRF
jgi:hypothetical protein